MIIGMGIDIVEVERISGIMSRHTEAFTRRVFTPSEIALAAERRNDLLFFAGRWAAKEAAAKALGSGFGGDCSPQDFELTSGPGGAPKLECRGAARELWKRRGCGRWNVSISHERHYAVAVVILEK